MRTGRFNYLCFSGQDFCGAMTRGYTVQGRGGRWFLSLLHIPAVAELAGTGAAINPNLFHYTVQGWSEGDSGSSQGAEAPEEEAGKQTNTTRHRSPDVLLTRVTHILTWLLTLQIPPPPPRPCLYRVGQTSSRPQSDVFMLRLQRWGWQQGIWFAYQPRQHFNTTPDKPHRLQIRHSLNSHVA